MSWERCLGLGGAMHDARKCAGIHGNPESSKTTWHCPTYKSVVILTNRHNNQGYTMKIRKGGESGSKKALNYGKQCRQTARKNVVGIQSKDPCNKACKCKPPFMLTVYRR